MQSISASQILQWLQNWFCCLTCHCHNWLAIFFHHKSVSPSPSNPPGRFATMKPCTVLHWLLSAWVWRKRNAFVLFKKKLLHYHHCTFSPHQNVPYIRLVIQYVLQNQSNFFCLFLFFRLLWIDFIMWGPISVTFSWFQQCFLSVFAELWVCVFLCVYVFLNSQHQFLTFMHSMQYIYIYLIVTVPMYVYIKNITLRIFIDILGCS